MISPCYNSCYSGVTEGVQVVRAHHPGKKSPKLKPCFLAKVICIYIKKLKESGHEAFLKKPEALEAAHT